MKNTIINTEKKTESVAKTSIEKLRYDYDLMLDYAIKRGILLPKQIILDNSNLNNGEMVANYNDLVNAIMPTSVESISYINKYVFRNEVNKKWFQIPIYSKGLVVSFLALFSVIAFSLSPNVNSESLSQGILSSSGITLFINLLFICSLALLGVMFYTIKSMNAKIKTYTLTEIDVLTLNSAILIGVISGFFISEVFSALVTGGLGGSVLLSKMTLAILGGFSSDAIFTMLQDIVNKLKALFTSTT